MIYIFWYENDKKLENKIGIRNEDGGEIGIR